MATSLLANFAIRQIGLSIAQGVWSGSTIAVSFIWGAAIFAEPTKSLVLSLVALGVLGVGIALISLAGSGIFKTESGYEALIATNSDEEKPQSTLLTYFIGLTAAIGLGFTNGSVLAPIHTVKNDAEKVGYIASFGLGLLIVTPVFATIYFLILRKTPTYNSLQMEDWLPVRGLVSGLMWNIGNFCSICATILLGFTLGFPLTQTALLVGGFWGIVLFKEVTGLKSIGVFVLGCLVLIGGAVLLALYSKK